MAAFQQQALVVDLIEAVKRKRSRKHNGPFQGTSSEAFYTNRGTKLRRNARYTQQGRLDAPFGASTYKQRIDYNGYQRNIISRNPQLYDDDGDAVEDEDDLPEDFASPYEENVYKDIRLEETLQPLVAASDLPTHPSLSHPYYDRGLPEMIRNAEEALHREQETLWKLKQLFTQLRGDSLWAPTEEFHIGYDDWLLGDGQSAGIVPDNASIQDHALAASVNGGEVQPITSDVRSSNGQEPSAATSTTSLPGGDQTENAPEEADETMDEDTLPNGQPPAADDPKLSGDEQTTQPITNGDTAQDSAMDTEHADAPNGIETAADPPPVEDTKEEPFPPDIPQLDDITSPPHRMTTRALARSSPPTLSRSPSPTSTSNDPHPIYTYPTSAISDFNIGLPSTIADASRACLLQYVSKQEEVVRQLKNLHHGLLKGLAMRRNVLKWCKAEGHVGELSDGEDWFDIEEWGLGEGELVKGREEEEDDAQQSKKTRRAAGREKN